MPNESSARAVSRAAAESHYLDPTALPCDEAQKSVAARMSLFADFAEVKDLVCYLDAARRWTGTGIATSNGGV